MCLYYIFIFYISFYGKICIWYLRKEGRKKLEEILKEFYLMVFNYIFRRNLWGNNIRRIVYWWKEIL